MKTIKNLTADQIRKSILQLAIQGKLVKQDPNDEPASELVKRIYEEKHRLIKEGKIKKDKNESCIYKGDDNCYYEKIGKSKVVKLDNLPFEIPDNWSWIRLSSFCDIYTGDSINESDKNKLYRNRQEGYDYIGTKDINFNHSIVYENGVKIPYNTGFKICPKSKILLCIEGGSAGRKIAFTSKAVCFGNKLACFNSWIIDDKYLYLFLQSPLFLQLFKDKLTGIISGVSINNLKQLFLPLPPLDEQERIVEKFKSCEPLLSQYELIEQNITLLETSLEEKLKASIIQYAIEGKLVKQDPNDEPASKLLERIKEEKEKLIKEGKLKRDKQEAEIVIGDDKNYYVSKALPASWVLVKAKQLTKKIQYGLSTSGQKSGKYKLLRITDIQKGQVNWNTLPFCDISEQKYIDYKIERDDIFIARTGGNIGKSFRLVESKENVVFAGYLIRFQLIFNSLSEYISRYLNSPAYWKQVSDKSMGTGQPNINGVSLGNLVIPLPPVSEQKRINNKINKLFCIIKSY